MNIRAQLRHAMFAAVSALPLTLAAIAVVHANQPGIAYVYDYTGPSTSYLLLRAGQSKAVNPFLPLQQGDRVRIVQRKDDSGRPSIITLSIGGQLYRVDAAHSPFCVGPRVAGCAANAVAGSPNPVLTALRNILASIAPFFGQAHDDYYSAQHDTMVSRGPAPPPSIPMLPSSPIAKLPSNSPTVAVAWSSGQAPYDVALTNAGGSHVLAERRGVSGASVIFTGVHLAPGIYAVQIQDQSHPATSASFQVVAPQAVPRLPIDSIINDPAIPASVRANAVVIRAASLAKIGGQQWYLAAYQPLAGLPDNSLHQVSELRYRLAEGLPPGD